MASTREAANLSMNPVFGIQEKDWRKVAEVQKSVKEGFTQVNDLLALFGISDPSGSKTDWKNLSDFSKFIQAVKLANAFVETIFDVTGKVKNSKRQAKLHSEITYKIIDEGEGEAITKNQQACFNYKQPGSVEIHVFEGSPTELATKFGRVYEKAIDGNKTNMKRIITEFEEAIEGMKPQGRRILFIPPRVSSLGVYTFIDLTLTSIDDSQPRKQNFTASKL